MKSIFRQTLTGLLLGGLVCAAQAQAADFRVGFVKIDRIIKESNAAKSIQSKLEQEFTKREKDIAAQDAALKAAADKFQIEAPTLPEAQRTSRQQGLVEQDRELQRQRRAFQEDLNARKNDELQKLLASANQVVRQLAAADKIDLVVQDAVYVNPKDDITDRVIQSMNAQNVK